MLQSSPVESPYAKRVPLGLRAPRRLVPSENLWRVILLFLGALVLVEALGRYLGLHTPILYEKTSYGYRPKPNQEFWRFGNHVFYDGHGLRSDPVGVVPALGHSRLLFIGDSILNGGARTDQSDTIPYRVRETMSATSRKVEVLNASSPGWAISNAAAWFNLYGTFHAQHVVLVTNTYDLFQPQAPSSVVGVHPAFPEHAPCLALTELYLRYLLPRFLRADEALDPGAEMRDAPNAVTANVLADLRWMLLRARKQNAKVLVVLVQPMIALSPAAQTQSEQALARLRADTTALNVEILDTRAAVVQAGGASLFRDGLHPTPEGNRIIAREIARHLLRQDGGAG